MNTNRLGFGLLLVTLALAFIWLPANAQSQQREALVLTLEGEISRTMEVYLERGLQAAEDRSVEVVILQLDTPGGDIVIMNQMVQVIRASSVPVIVYVAPRGAIAGSAGTVITLAGHKAAMAPETAIGAASPVGTGGEDLGQTLETKLKEATKATIRSLTEGRPPEAVTLAEDTVENAIAVSAREAFEVGLVDYIANDIPDLLDQLDGVTVETTAGTLTLSTDNLIITPFNITLIEQILAVLTNPNIIFILLTIGVQAILIELGSPGGWVAGFIGVLCLTLAAYGIGFLPFNWVGLILLATSFVLFVLDVKAPTHGALTTVGTATLIAGALVLFNSGGTPEFFRVSVPLVVVTSLLTAGSFFFLLSFVIRAQKRPPSMGQASLVGRRGVLRSDLAPYKQVQLQLAGELWSAELAEGEETLESGTRVEVVAVEGVRLKVKKVQPSD